MAADNKPRWFGEAPTDCQLCQTPLSECHSRVRHNGQMVEVFIDGRLHYGPWAILCISCHEDNGVGLGTGRGQMYLVEPPHYKIGG